MGSGDFLPGYPEGQTVVFTLEQAFGSNCLLTTVSGDEFMALLAKAPFEGGVMPTEESGQVPLLVERSFLAGYLILGGPGGATYFATRLAAGPPPPTS